MPSATAPLKAMLVTTLSCALFAGCTQDPDKDLVIGQLVGGAVGPKESIIYSAPAAAGGVQVTSSAGGGKRPFVLTGSEAIRLIDRMEDELRRWSESKAADPFERTLIIGLAGTVMPEPFSVRLVKRPGMVDPVFLVTLAYADATASAMLDRTNATKWVRQLRAAARY